jgi:hypothetical protein
MQFTLVAKVRLSHAVLEAPAPRMGLGNRLTATKYLDDLSEAHVLKKVKQEKDHILSE